MRALNALPRIAELSLEAARRAASLGLSVVRTVAAPILGHDRSDDHLQGRTRNHQPPSSRPAGEPPASPRRAAAPVKPPAPAVTPQARAVPVSPPQPPEPVHVEREAVVVAESADPGAADGAGAELRIPEPWDGYRYLKAKDVTAQLATADAATLAVVRLYESTHRKRRTVLSEIDRRLAIAES